MGEKKCVKCGFEESENRKKHGFFLCAVCLNFAPHDPEQFDHYILEKIDGTLLTTFRKHATLPGEKQKQGMIKKAEEGKVMSRVPFGYKFEQGTLIPAQHASEVEDIFEEFLNSTLSLRQLAKKRGFSVNGLKKILTNFSYLGKVKFDNNIHNGMHEPLVSSTLFNHVQNKFERLGLKKAS